MTFDWNYFSLRGSPTLIWILIRGGEEPTNGEITSFYCILKKNLFTESNAFSMSIVIKSLSIWSEFVISRISEINLPPSLIKVHGKTTYEWDMDDIRIHTSDIRMTFEFIRVTYGWHTSTYEWHTGDIEYIRVT